MSIQPAIWELKLLAKAQEAYATSSIDSRIELNAHVLKDAYRYCRSITRNSSQTFYLASLLLPQHKQLAVQALYAFCRITDDLVDETQDLKNAAEIFSDWCNRLNTVHPSTYDPVPLAWANAQTHYGIPKGYADQLIKGVAYDQKRRRYQTFGELTEYCYGVASTVGLMAMHIIGFTDYQRALPYAIKLGIALQLTNILRDVGEDLQNGRFYLPLNELSSFGISEDEVFFKRKNDDRWQAFMRFQIERVHRLYDEAEPGIALLNKDGRFAIGAATRLYRAILNDIEEHHYDVFTRRAHTTLTEKFRQLPRIWWQSRAEAPQE